MKRKEKAARNGPFNKINLVIGNGLWRVIVVNLSLDFYHKSVYIDNLILKQST